MLKFWFLTSVIAGPCLGGPSAVPLAERVRARGPLVELEGAVPRGTRVAFPRLFRQG